MLRQQQLYRRWLDISRAPDCRDSADDTHQEAVSAFTRATAPTHAAGAMALFRCREARDNADICTHAMRDD